MDNRDNRIKPKRTSSDLNAHFTPDGNITTAMPQIDEDGVLSNADHAKRKKMVHPRSEINLSDFPPFPKQGVLTHLASDSSLTFVPTIPLIPSSLSSSTSTLNHLLNDLQVQPLEHDPIKLAQENEEKYRLSIKQKIETNAQYTVRQRAKDFNLTPCYTRSIPSKSQDVEILPDAEVSFPYLKIQSLTIPERQYLYTGSQYLLNDPESGSNIRMSLRIYIGNGEVYSDAARQMYEGLVNCTIAPTVLKDGFYIYFAVQRADGMCELRLFKSGDAGHPTLINKTTEKPLAAGEFYKSGKQLFINDKTGRFHSDIPIDNFKRVMPEFLPTTYLPQENYYNWAKIQKNEFESELINNLHLCQELQNRNMHPFNQALSNWIAEEVLKTLTQLEKLAQKLSPSQPLGEGTQMTALNNETNEIKLEFKQLIQRLIWMKEIKSKFPVFDYAVKNFCEKVLEENRNYLGQIQKLGNENPEKKQDLEKRISDNQANVRKLVQFLPWIKEAMPEAYPLLTALLPTIPHSTADLVIERHIANAGLNRQDILGQPSFGNSIGVFANTVQSNSPDPQHAQDNNQAPSPTLGANRTTE